MAIGFGGSRNNDAPMPRQDSSGRNASSASRPSSSGYASATRGGNLSSNGLGVTTGKTVYGNTAFGPSGGRATGYATNSRPGSGMAPSMGSYSNFRGLDGSPMLGGALQNRQVTARNPQQALGMLRALQAAQGYQRPASGRVGGLLDGEQVTVGPPSVQPAAGYNNAWYSWIPMTDRPYDKRTSPPTMGRAGSVVPAPRNYDMMLLGGAGMPGLGMVPRGGGSWSNEWKDYLRGDSAPSAWDRFTDSVGRWWGRGATYQGN